MTKIRSICIDTLTGIQNELWMTNSKKPGHDQWLDYGKDIWQLISDLQNRKFTTVMILGEPGVGKSTGMRNLPSKTNIWFNADKKDPVWIGGREEYGKIYNPTPIYHVLPNNYTDIITAIDTVGKEGFEDEKFAFLTGHIEDYKSGNENKKRLKTLGKITTKMQLEGKLNNVFYANVVRDGSNNKYLLETQTDGVNTARSPMGLFEPIIENDYNFIIEKLMSY